MSAADKKAVVKNADMSEEMQQDAVECATHAMEQFKLEKDIFGIRILVLSGRRYCSSHKEGI